MIGKLGGLVATNGWDGINIDFEAGAASDRGAFTRWIAELSRRFHVFGKSVTVEVSAKYQEPWSGRAEFYDYAGLAASADNVFVMNWGQHWSTSTPGATGELWWTRRVADFVGLHAEQVEVRAREQHVRLRLGERRRDRPPGHGARVRRRRGPPRADGARRRLRRQRVRPHFSYTDSQGDHHDVWYTDARSIAARAKLARDRGLGIGLWRLGREDQAVWNDPVLAP